MKLRLDRLLVSRGLVESREKAQALIMAGEVLVGGQKASKPGQPVAEDAVLEVLARPLYASRGGLKLAAVGYLPQVAEIDRSFPLSVADTVLLGAWRQSGGAEFRAGTWWAR